MRIIRYIFTALLAIAAMCSCTHNNGDIGPLFGQWKITDIATTDAATGTVTHNATSGAFLSFQNDVVTLTQVAKIKMIANAIDSDAFMIIMSANEVMGRGFSSPGIRVGNVIKRYEGKDT